jgi:hypothetical protein
MVPLVEVELVYVVHYVELALHVGHHLPGCCVAVQLDSRTCVSIKLNLSQGQWRVTSLIAISGTKEV